MIGLVFFLVFLEKLLYDVCLMGIIKKSTRRGAKLDPIRIPTVCWKTRPSSITNMLSIKNSNMFMISENSLQNQSGFLFAKLNVSLPKRRYLYLRWPFIFMKHSWTYSFNLSLSIECGNSCVAGKPTLC
jgi:hypothetical protein